MLFLCLLTRLPMEVIGHGEVSTGSDVYTLAMLFYEFYTALSGTKRLQCRPFSKMHPSRVHTLVYAF